MMEVLEIFFSDLTEKCQKEVLELYEIEHAEEANLDIFPLFTLSKEIIEMED